MNLYLVQSDGDSLHVVAESYQEAIDTWRDRCVDGVEPDGVALIADSDDLDISAADKAPAFRERVHRLLMTALDDANTVGTPKARDAIIELCKALDLPTSRDDVPF